MYSYIQAIVRHEGFLFKDKTFKYVILVIKIFWIKVLTKEGLFLYKKRISSCSENIFSNNRKIGT